MPNKRSPNREKCDDELRALGRPPTWDEAKQLSKKFKVPSGAPTIWKWARKIYPTMLERGDQVAAAAATSTSSPAPSAAAVSVTPVAAEWDVVADHVDDANSPPDEAAEPPTVEGGGHVAAGPVPFPTEATILTLVTMSNARFRAGGIEEISKEEQEMLVAAWDPIAQQYLAEAMAKHMPLVLAIGATAAVFGPRLMDAKAKKDAREQSAAAHEDARIRAIEEAQLRAQRAPAAPAAEPAPSWKPIEHGHAPDSTIAAAFGGRATG